LVKLFQPPPQPIGEVIFQTVRRLKTQQLRLEQATIRLRQRDRTLFSACVAQVRMKHPERATICANELSEVRKVLNMVTQCQLALERIVLRLETIKEVSEIMADLGPALRSLRVLTETMVNVMPDIAQELQRVNDSISETLAITKVNAPETVAPLTAKTQAGEEILKEVSAVLERKLSEELPAPPISVAKEKVDSSRESLKKQMIALSATCSEVSQPIEEQARAQGKSQSYVTYKDVELRGVSFTIERQNPVEDAILQYAKEKGEIDLDQCANELSVPHEDVERALENLGKKRKIVIQR
jgi:division protein CdvB (Snf7/Vps24/ESCRT-III family)